MRVMGTMNMIFVTDFPTKEIKCKLGMALTIPRTFLVKNLPNTFSAHVKHIKT